MEAWMAFVSIMAIVAIVVFAGGLIAFIWTFFSKNTCIYLSNPFFLIMIIFVVIIVKVIQETGLLISKKIDKRRIL